MIQLFTGTPGSGKSLHMAKEIFYYANRKKETLIITNFDIVTDKLKHPERIVVLKNNLLKTPEKVVQLALDYFQTHERKENSIVLFIDESQLIFNSRDWNTDGRSEWLSFFTQHRKLGFMVILTAQFDMMLDKQIRALIEYETTHRKVTNYGVAGLFMQLFALGQPLFVSVEKWYSINERTGFGFFIARKKYYSLYDTFNTFDNVVS